MASQQICRKDSTTFSKILSIGGKDQLTFILSFRFLQEYFLKDIQRGKPGLGKYSLVDIQHKIELSEMKQMETMHFIDIVKS